MSDQPSHTPTTADADLRRTGSGTGNPQRRFPCSQCGGQLNYAPGTTAIKCPYCGHENEIPESVETVEEIDYLSAIEDAEKNVPHEDVHVVRCTACNAETQPAPTVSAYNCPYCGASIVNVAGSRHVIKPRSLLPFSIDRRTATDAYLTWLGKRWFAPNDLKKYARSESRFQGIYVPYWTYDCATTTSYTGQRGDRYTVTVGSGNNRRTETRIRWRPAQGTVENDFDDLLVMASGSMPPALIERLTPWDLESLVPYTDEYLSGFMAESYAVDLKGGFEVARQMMVPEIDATIRADIGGDVQRIDAKRSRCRDVTFKHILLPVWICAYRYRGRLFRVVVNARTGEVQGDRPYSWIKITLLVLACVIALLVVIILFNR